MSDTPPLHPPPLAGPNKGGRPKIDPAAVRSLNLSVRLSPAEYAAFGSGPTQLGMKPGQFLRQAGLTRRLPPPPCAGRQPRRVGQVGAAGQQHQPAHPACQCGPADRLPRRDYTGCIAPK